MGNLQTLPAVAAQGEVWYNVRMGLVKTRRLAAMQKQQRAKVRIKLPTRSVVTYHESEAKVPFLGNKHKEKL